MPFIRVVDRLAVCATGFNRSVYGTLWLVLSADTVLPKGYPRSKRLRV